MNVRPVDAETTKWALDAFFGTLGLESIPAKAPDLNVTEVIKTPYERWARERRARRKALRLGIVYEDLGEYERLREGERFSRAEAIRIVKASRRPTP